MATSIVARSMAVFMFCVIFLVTLASAQSVSPSNSTLPDSEKNSETELKLSGDAKAPSAQYNIAPLTESQGKGQNAVDVAAIQITGNLKFADPSNMNITGEDIAYISCDPAAGNIDASRVVSTIGGQNPPPKAILLYSLISLNCELNGTFSYQSLYTMTSQADSMALYGTINQSPQSTNILSAMIGTNSTSTSGQGSSATSTNNDGGPAPTTAVAMSILYSITGIITLLFLVIIATGAIRAHRHPERYGPRTGHTGRPRQSRAKGLARAMLETLPIVKFGDPEPVKPENRDIELENGNTLAHPPSEIMTVPESTPAVSQTKTVPATTTIESGMGPNTQAESIKSGQEPVAADGELGCSICTEDFTTGEDVRVLPCKHKYHPACIDPWLLNVSGTCPLCRHDLRPVTSATSQTAPAAEGDELPPPLSAEAADGDAAETTSAAQDESSDAHQRRRASRFLDLHRLRTAPADERIAALRRLREQSRRDGEAAEDVEEPSRRARLTGRLRDTFRIRTRRQNDETPQNGD